jgi:hypothetical protein
MESQGRLLHRDWDRYDTRHVVFRTRGMSEEQLEAGYWRAYRDFYRWGSILRGAATKPTLTGRVRHFAYAAGWKKFEPLWDLVIRAKRIARMRPVLESVLSCFGLRGSTTAAATGLTPAESRGLPVEVVALGQARGPGRGGAIALDRG